MTRIVEKKIEAYTWLHHRLVVRGDSVLFARDSRGYIIRIEDIDGVQTLHCGRTFAKALEAARAAAGEEGQA